MSTRFLIGAGIVMLLTALVVTYAAWQADGFGLRVITGLLVMASFIINILTLWQSRA